MHLVDSLLTMLAASPIQLHSWLDKHWSLLCKSSPASPQPVCSQMSVECVGLSGSLQDIHRKIICIMTVGRQDTEVEIVAGRTMHRTAKQLKMMFKHDFWSNYLLHRFEFDPFFMETHRILKPGATFAAWQYFLPEVQGNEAATQLIYEIYKSPKYLWNLLTPRTQYVANGYADIHPTAEYFEDEQRKHFYFTTESSIEQLVSHLSSRRTSCHGVALHCMLAATKSSSKFLWPRNSLLQWISDNISTFCSHSSFWQKLLTWVKKKCTNPRAASSSSELQKPCIREAQLLYHLIESPNCVLDCNTFIDFQNSLHLSSRPIRMAYVFPFFPCFIDVVSTTQSAGHCLQTGWVSTWSAFHLYSKANPDRPDLRNEVSEQLMKALNTDDGSFPITLNWIGNVLLARARWLEGFTVGVQSPTEDSISLIDMLLWYLLRIGFFAT